MESANASAELLRSARPNLILHVKQVDHNDRNENVGSLHYTVRARIVEVCAGWDHILREGYDQDNSPLCRPVYWRIVIRGLKEFYLSTYLATPEEIDRGWGSKGLGFCDPVTGCAVARIETLLTVRSASASTRR